MKRPGDIFLDKNKDQLMIFALLAVVLGVYSPCFKFGFLNWDDYQHFCYNPCVYGFSWNNFWNIFQQTPNHTFIPLTILSFNLEYLIFGLSPAAAHVINVLLHAGVVMAVFGLARQMRFSSWEAFIAGLVFAAHPLHVESVAWVTERKDVLSILFYVLCLRRYWAYLETRGPKDYGVSLLFGFLSILSKPMAVSLPWALLLLDWFYGRRTDKAMIVEKLPFAALIFPIAAVTVFKLSPHPHLGENSILIGLWSFSWYLEKFVLPVDLMPAYTPPVPVVLSNFIYLKSLLIFLLFTGAIYAGRRSRLLVFACLWWVVTIFFFWRFDFRDSNIVADRFMYLPSLGFCLLAGRYLARFKVFSIVLAVILSVLSFNQCRIWRDDLTLWTWTLSHDPKNVIAKENQAQAIYEREGPRPDYKMLTHAIDQNPSKAENYFKRGRALFGETDFYLAFNDFNKAIALDPSNDMAYIRRGQLFLLAGEHQKALDDFRKAIAIKADNALAFLQASTIFESTGDNKQALAWLDKAASIDPSMGGIYYQRGLVFEGMEQYEKAIAEFTRASALYNDHKNTYYHRAMSHEALKQFGPAEDDYRRTLKEDPYDIKVLNQLGTLYLKQGKDEAALKVFNKIIALYPYYDNAYNNRGIVYLHLKQYDLALQDYSQAIRLGLYPYHSLITRGDIYLAMGRPQKALDDYKTAVLFSRGDPVAKLKLDRLKAMIFVFTLK